VRRLLRHRGWGLSGRGLGAAGARWGVVVGGTTGAGVILLSMLMAARLEGAAVIATDAVISIVMGLVKIAVFGFAGVVTAQVVAVALLIGLVAFRAPSSPAPGRAAADHVHTAILDAVVVVGGAAMIAGAFRP